MIPRFDFDPANEALCTSPLVFEMQLNKVVFPELASPIIPQRKGINVSFYAAKLINLRILEDLERPGYPPSIVHVSSMVPSRFYHCSTTDEHFKIFICGRTVVEP